MKKHRILIADDHRLYNEGLASILGSQSILPVQIVGQILDGDEVLDAVQETTPDVLILDLNLPGTDGLTLLPKIKKKYQSLKILIVTMYDDSKFIQESLKSGAHGYLLKSSGLKELLNAIKEILEGQTYVGEDLIIFPKELTESGNGKYQDGYTIKSKLTKRELEILKLITTAKSSKEIAEILFISDQTVSVHRKNIMRKLNVNNTASLIKFAIDNHLI